jgi:tyrosine-protein phosphatase SIW14
VNSYHRRLGFAGASLLFLLALTGCTTGGNKDVAQVPNFGEVSPDVWRGGKPNREGMQWLAGRGVKTIIDLQMDDESADVPAGVKYVPIRVSLWRCDRVDVAAVMRAIEESPKPVFIHCLIGRDRTGLAAAAWQLNQGKSAEEAIADMERFGINPFFNGAIKKRIRELAKDQEKANANKSSAAAR